MAKIIVVGAGVVGVTSAFLLAQSGHEVRIVEQFDAPCKGTSERNGAQLSYSYCDALGSMALIKQLPGILGGKDPGFRIRVPLDPAFLLWGMKFLAQCTPRAFMRNTGALLKLAKQSQQVLIRLLEQYELSFDYKVSGKMVVVPRQQSLETAQKMMALRQAHGIDQRYVSNDEACEMEPAFNDYQGEMVGALFSPEDAVGSPSQFCAQLLDIGRAEFGLEVQFSTIANRIEIHKGRVVGLGWGNGETLACDHIVLCTGVMSPTDNALRPQYGTLWPIQGYSLTADAPDRMFSTSVTDTNRKMVFATLGDKLRVAGTADIGKQGAAFDPQRFEVFVAAASDAFGLDLDPDRLDLQPWTGARPCTPDSLPIIAPMRTKGLFANYGHGAVGWTLSLGSAERLCDVIAAEPV